MSTVDNKSGNNVSRLTSRFSQDFSSKSDVAVRKPPSSLGIKKPRYCKARFSYAAEQTDELTFEAETFIKAVEEVEEGWMRGVVINMKTKSPDSQQIGLFPTNFVEFNLSNEDENLLNSILSPSSATTQISAAASSKPKPPMEEKKEEKKVDHSIAKREPLIASSRRVPSTSSSVDILDTSAESKLSNKEKGERALVLYPYKAEQSDELELTENTTVLVLDKHSTDDGWFFGEYQGKTGVFPSNFVTLLGPANSQAPPTPPPTKPPKPHMSNNKELPKPGAASSSDMKSKSADSSHEVIDIPKPSTTYIAAAAACESFASKHSAPPAGDSFASKHSTANDSFGSKHSGFETASKSNDVTSPVKSGPVVPASNTSVNSAATGASSKIKNLQNTLFQNRAVPKPGDKPIRPVTTIIDNYNGPEDEENMVKESDSNDVKMSHPSKDRPKQCKRPPSMMPVITSSDSTTSLSNGASNGVATTTTNFPVKESPPVVTQKPLLPTVKTQHKSDNESKSSQKIHTETTLVPTKKAAAPSSSVSSASTSCHISPLPYLSEDEKVTAKHYNHIAKAFNDLLKEVTCLKQELRSHSSC